MTTHVNLGDYRWYWDEPIPEDQPLFIPVTIPVSESKEGTHVAIDQVMADQIAASSLQSHTQAMTNRQHDANYSTKLLEGVMAKKFDEIQTLEAGAASRIQYGPPQPS